MKLLVVSGDDVRRTLPMRLCVDPMAETLAALGEWALAEGLGTRVEL